MAGVDLELSLELLVCAGNGANYARRLDIVVPDLPLTPSRVAERSIHWTSESVKLFALVSVSGGGEE